MTALHFSRNGWLSGLRSTVGAISWPAVITGRAASLAAVVNQLDRSQWLAPEELEALQFGQLRELIAHAIEHIPFYRERLACAGIGTAAEITPDSWRRIPVLERGELQQRGAELLSDAVPDSHGRVAESSTSGSTGRRVTVTKTELADFFFQAFVLRAGDWERWDTAGRLAAIRWYPPGVAEYPDGIRRADWGTPYAQLCDSGPSYELNVIATSVAQQAEWLARMQPDYLTIFPSILPDLIEACEDRGVTLPRLKQVRTVGEWLDPAHRAQVKERWGVSVSDVYSAQEAGYMALQCPETEHYHVQSEGALVEVLDERGGACAPGETGRVVVTPLHNFAMPLLRYAIGDYAEVGAPCRCGRGLPVLARVSGRVRNMIVLPDGARRWPSLGFFSGTSAEAVKQYQCVQTAAGDIDLRLVVARALTPAEEAVLRAKVAEVLGHPFRVTISYHRSIPRSAGGKFEQFMSQLVA